MAGFSGGNGAFTPSTTADNWVLDADAAGDVGQITSVSFGGRLTTSVGYRTRWFRPGTNASATFTSLNPQAKAPATTPTCRLGTFSTNSTPPTDPANLLAIDWNANGGIGYIVMPLASPWIIVNSATAGHQQVACRNTAGVDANGSSYSVDWNE